MNTSQPKPTPKPHNNERGASNKPADFVIVGAGPAGLTLAWVLSTYGYSVTIIDREASIGGLHRVRRYGPDQLFTEHGPRVYGTNYLSTRIVLESLGVDWNRSFTPYAFFFNNISRNVLAELTIWETLAYVKGFISFLINPEPSKKITVAQFMDANNFSDKSRDFIERICRLTDGAGSDRYTLWEFFELINQNFAYSIVQPVVPNDVGFLKKWEEGLVTNGVNIMLNTEVNRINLSNREIQSINVCSGAATTITIYGKRFIFAIPLWNLVNILEKSGPVAQSAYGPFDKLIQYTRTSEYNTYIPVTLHWDTKLTLPKQWGYPRGNWQVGVLVLSDYMKFNNPKSQTVISTVVSNINEKSNLTGKTANQSLPNEVVAEVISEVRKMYPGIPDPTTALISPEMSKGNKNTQWGTIDKAFILTPAGFLGGAKSPVIGNMYAVGQYNGKSTSAFTSFEGAVTNALSLLHDLVPASRKKFPIIEPLTIRTIILRIALLLVIVYVLWRIL